ncbi:hypothetical protein QBC39DRAFT_177122 [Podospora conica]|nr:hypothetical protein QBC39DRAFT_177122 [Schizothecium conicum]
MSTPAPPETSPSKALWRIRARQLQRFHHNGANHPTHHLIRREDLQRAELLCPFWRKKESDDEENWPPSWEANPRSLKSTFTHANWRAYPVSLPKPPVTVLAQDAAEQDKNDNKSPAVRPERAMPTRDSAGLMVRAKHSPVAAERHVGPEMGSVPEPSRADDVATVTAAQPAADEPSSAVPRLRSGNRTRKERADVTTVTAQPAADEPSSDVPWLRSGNRRRKEQGEEALEQQEPAADESGSARPGNHKRQKDADVTTVAAQPAPDEPSSDVPWLRSGNRRRKEQGEEALEQHKPATDESSSARPGNYERQKKAEVTTTTVVQAAADKPNSAVPRQRPGNHGRQERADVTIATVRQVAQVAQVAADKPSSARPSNHERQKEVDVTTATVPQVAQTTAEKPARPGNHKRQKDAEVTITTVAQAAADKPSSGVPRQRPGNHGRQERTDVTTATVAQVAADESSSGVPRQRPGNRRRNEEEEEEEAVKQHDPSSAVPRQRPGKLGRKEQEEDAVEQHEPSFAVPWLRSGHRRRKEEEQEAVKQYKPAAAVESGTLGLDRLDLGAQDSGHAPASRHHRTSGDDALVLAPDTGGFPTPAEEYVSRFADEDRRAFHRWLRSLGLQISRRVTGELVEEDV